jgi:protein-S-isoprenylcysteine O-methyltransferase Ste14
MPETTLPERAALRRSLWSLAVMLMVMGVLLFVPAGTLDWPRGWWFAGAFVVAILVSLVVLWRLNPDIFIARSRVAAPGTEAWDYIFVTLVVGGFIAVLPVAALDFRFGGADLPDWVVGLGYLLFVLGFAGQLWSQVVNSFFEPSVRLQSDRGQRVIDTGPYAIIRHPGYLTGALLTLSLALCLGSAWALLPALVVTLALIVRTYPEERMLRDKLPGYSEYAQRVKYRWVPGIW